MMLEAQILPVWFSNSVLVLWLCTLGVATVAADWQAVLAVPARAHLLLGSCVGWVTIWLLGIAVNDSVLVHLLGVTAVTLVLGLRFTLVVGSVAVVAHTLLLSRPLAVASTAWLLSVAVPALASRWLVHRLRTLGRRNPFIYMLGAGFGGGLLSVLAVAATAMAVLYLIGQPDLAGLAWDNWPMIFLLLFPEGFINGMVVTTLAVFQPGWLKTFDDDYYLGEQ